jgi:hypothetical protein
MYCDTKYKRLEAGVFHFPQCASQSVEIEAARLTLILEGIDLTHARQGRRFRQPRDSSLRHSA